MSATPTARRRKSAAPGPPKPAIPVIVVGLDGSASSEAALNLAIVIARGVGARVTAVHAIDVPSDYPELKRQRAEFHDGWLRSMRGIFENEWCKPLIDSGLRYRAIMEQGSAARAISRVAVRERAGLIVTGRRGRGKVSELVLGSVSHELVHASKLPVLVTEPAVNEGRRRVGSGWTRR